MGLFPLVVYENSWLLCFSVYLHAWERGLSSRDDMHPFALFSMNKSLSIRYWMSKRKSYPPHLSKKME